jgi:splicing factor 3B subunit 2
MGLTTAERNRRKRERKKKGREQNLKDQKEFSASAQNRHPEDPHSGDRQDAKLDNGSRSDVDDDDIEVEYVPEPINLPEDQFADVLRAQQQAAAAIVVALPGSSGAAIVVSDEDNDDTNIKGKGGKRSEENGDYGDDEYDNDDDDDDDDDDDEGRNLSKRKLRELLRPTVAELKKRVKRPDLVEAHDVTANDPDFLIALKSIPGTVPVPRHWGRKRKYLQGKRGFEKAPFQLPDFIVNTGITDVRDAAAQEDKDMSAKQRNRARVAPKMGAIDVDYKVLYDAFFKHQTKPASLTKFGDMYYEGKEMETQTGHVKPGWPYSKQLREALGMVSATSPPPWLVNMQRYGPPPSYPGMKIPGLNAPLPTPECQYGYHPGGWGKPPLDPYGRPLYGGNPFDPPGTFGRDVDDSANPFGAVGAAMLVTSDGKTLAKSDWGALPTGEAMADEEEGESEEEEESGSEMDESDEEGEEPMDGSGMESVLPPRPFPPRRPRTCGRSRRATKRPFQVHPRSDSPSPCTGSSSRRRVPRRSSCRRGPSSRRRSRTRCRARTCPRAPKASSARPRTKSPSARPRMPTRTTTTRAWIRSSSSRAKYELPSASIQYGIIGDQN